MLKKKILNSYFSINDDINFIYLDIENKFYFNL